MSFTFASTSAAPNQAGTQNTLKPGAIGFSSVSAAAAPPTTMPNTGFGAFNTGFMKPGGTFASGTGIGNNPIGAGYSGAGFPSSTGFGSASTGLNPNGLGANMSQELPPYKGIKGPGYGTTWQSAVDFSQINDHTLFDSLPPVLQQHLMELHAFANNEEESIKAVTDYLNGIEPTSTSKDAANGTKDTNLGSYQHQSRQLAELKGGNHAVPIVAVACEHHEKEAQSFSQHLDQFESTIREYQHRVWEPLLASGNLTHAKNNNTSNSLNDMNPFDRNANAKSPLLMIIEELQDSMKTLSGKIEELRMDVMPSLTSNHLISAADAAKQDRGLGSYAPNAYLSHRDGRAPPYSHASLVGYSDRSDCSQLYPQTFSPLNGTTTSTSATSVLSAGPAEPSAIVPQINASLMNLLTSLTNLSTWADHLHKRSDSARGIFTRQYGQYEADVLFKPPITSQETLSIAPGLPAANAVSTTAAVTSPAAAQVGGGFSVVNTGTNTSQPVGGFAGFGQLGQRPAGLFGVGKAKPAS